MPSKPELGSIYRHKARGTDYVVVGNLYAEIWDKFDGKTYWLVSRKLKTSQTFEFVTGIYREKAKQAVFKLAVIMQRSIMDLNQRATDIVFYQGLDDGIVWARSLQEFMDGRFELAK